MNERGRYLESIQEEDSKVDSSKSHSSKELRASQHSKAIKLKTILDEEHESEDLVHPPGLQSPKIYEFSLISKEDVLEKYGNSASRSCSRSGSKSSTGDKIKSQSPNKAKECENSENLSVDEKPMEESWRSPQEVV